MKDMASNVEPNISIGTLYLTVSNNNCSCPREMTKVQETSFLCTYKKVYVVLLPRYIMRSKHTLQSCAQWSQNIFGVVLNCN